MVSLAMHAAAWLALAGVLVIAPRYERPASVDVAWTVDEAPIEVETFELVPRATPPVEYESPRPELTELREPEPHPEPSEPLEPIDPSALPGRVPPGTFRKRDPIAVPMRSPRRVNPPTPIVIPPTTATMSDSPTASPAAHAVPVFVPSRPLASNPPPPYPRRALRRGIEGIVEIDVSIDAAGHVATLRIRSSSGSARLDRAAIETVRTWKFAPATRGGVPVADEITIPVRFRIGTRANTSGVAPVSST